MLAVSTPLRSNKDDSCREIMGEMAETRSTNTATAGFSSIGSSSMDDSFPPAADDDFSAGNLLDSIDFDDLFVGIHDVEVLPDLEMDPELLAEFSLSLSPDPAGGEYSVDAHFVNSPPSNTIFSGDAADFEDNSYSKCNSKKKDDDDDKSAVRQVVGRDGGGGSHFEEEKKEQGKDEATTLEIDHKSKKQGSYESQEEEEETEAAVVVMSPNSNNNSSSSPKDGDPDCCKRKKWSSKSSRNNDAGYSTTTTTTTTGHNNQSKRKAKVDWTPELHRRFVQAVEQLGVDKAVPSRILELMGIDCLTRHNIASHLQKYRSHRKHLLAREADAASWSQKRQMYGAAAMGAGGKGAIVNPWHATTIGFPPAMAPPPPVPPPASTIHPHHFRPLHVWGHPTHNQSMMPPPPMWPPPPPTADPAAFWHPPHHHVPNGVAPARPFFPIPPPLPTTRFSASPVPGLPPHAMYRPDLGIPGAGQPSQTAPLDFHPTKESIDAAIGDVLAKPYLPLPIGLKPPAVDSVLVELQRQGVPKIPPSCA